MAVLGSRNAGILATHILSTRGWTASKLAQVSLHLNSYEIAVLQAEQLPPVQRVRGGWHCSLYLHAHTIRYDSAGASNKRNILDVNTG